MEIEAPVDIQTDWLARVIIRRMIRSDLPALEWGGEFAHFRRLYRDIFNNAAKGKATLWVADLQGVGVIGQLFVQISSARPELADGLTRGYIYGFRIQPLFRGNGLGTQMMDIAEADLSNRGFYWVTLNVAKENWRARRLYERLGYAVIGSEEGKWNYMDEKGIRHEVHEPAWRMEKRLR